MLAPGAELTCIARQNGGRILQIFRGLASLYVMTAKEKVFLEHITSPPLARSDF